MGEHECVQKEKISKLDDKLDSIESKLAVLVELKADIKSNSEFRIQAKTIVGAISFFFMVLGGLIVWAVTKFTS